MLGSMPRSPADRGLSPRTRAWGTTQYVREFVERGMPEGWFTVKEIAEMIGHPGDVNKAMRGADLNPILHKLQEQYLVVKSTVHFGPKGERLWCKVMHDKVEDIPGRPGL